MIVNLVYHLVSFKELLDLGVINDWHHQTTNQKKQQQQQQCLNRKLIDKCD